ncbi:MAG TPA: LytR C-terminal domain-containing protein, partial [Ilumatobacter sp.]|nr:LytR C-terminal domain-containing protein [Ilumatobacter sp.]
VNASGLGGVAGVKAEELEVAGYVDVAAVNAVLSTETSTIYFAAGLEREAMIAAADLGWGGAPLRPMAQAPELRTEDSFDLLVVIGTDRAEPVPEQ